MRPRSKVTIDSEVYEKSIRLSTYSESAPHNLQIRASAKNRDTSTNLSSHSLIKIQPRDGQCSMRLTKETAACAMLYCE